MKSLLIKDTTLEERKEIVQNALSFGAGDCDDCDLSDLYDDYILGLRELADINREFSEQLMEQREQSQTRLGYAESWQKKTEGQHAGEVVAAKK